MYKTNITSGTCRESLTALPVDAAAPDTRVYKCFSYVRARGGGGHRCSGDVRFLGHDVRAEVTRPTNRDRSSMPISVRAKSRARSMSTVRSETLRNFLNRSRNTIKNKHRIVLSSVKTYGVSREYAYYYTDITLKRTPNRRFSRGFVLAIITKF